MFYIQSPERLLQRRLDLDPARVTDAVEELALEANDDPIAADKFAAFMRYSDPQAVIRFVTDSGLEG